MSAETTPSDLKPNQEQIARFRTLIEKITGPLPPESKNGPAVPGFPPELFHVNEVWQTIELNRHTNSPVGVEARLARTRHGLHSPMLVGGDAVFIVDKFQGFVAFSNNEHGGITKMRGEKGQGITASSVQRELRPEEIDEVLLFLENPVERTELVDKFLAMTEGETEELDAKLAAARAQREQYLLTIEGLRRAREAFFTEDDGTLIA